MDVRVKVAEGKKLYWRGRDRTGGEIIEVPEKEARLIVAVKKGTIVTDDRPKVPDPQPVREPLATRTLRAEPVKPLTTDEVPATPRYRRRDMRAKE